MKIIQTDAVGNKLYNRQQFTIVGNTVRPSDSVGNIDYSSNALLLLQANSACNVNDGITSTHKAQARRGLKSI